MKRARSDSSSSSDYSSDQSARKAKHREGYNTDWKEQYPWLLPVADPDAPLEFAVSCAYFVSVTK